MSKPTSRREYIIEGFVALLRHYRRASWPEWWPEAKTVPHDKIIIDPPEWSVWTHYVPYVPKPEVAFDPLKKVDMRRCANALARSIAKCNPGSCSIYFRYAPGELIDISIRPPGRGAPLKVGMSIRLDETMADLIGSAARDGGNT